MAENQDFKMDGKTLDITKENIAAMKQLFPEIVTDGKVDFEKLRLILGDEIETSDERYNFTWHGKNQAIRLSQTPSMGTLRPCKEDSVNWDTTKNLYIEGDNLEVLKLLQRSYFGKIKMIYIDPPYNTGGDFVYRDNFYDSIDNYKKTIGLIDDGGNQISTNSNSEGRFHTNWLNMIYPRIKLARNLLSEDGAIFISIDDHEVDNLSKICNEIFGELNYVCRFIWKSKQGKVGTTSKISTIHEYILCYAKSIDELNFKKITALSEGRRESLRQWGTADRREDRPSMFYPITIDGTTVYPIKEDGTEGRWRVGQETAQQLLAEGCLEIVQGKHNTNIVRIFPPGISETPFDSILSDIGTTANGAIKLKKMGLTNVFDYSKPVDLISFFINLFNDTDFTVLDFFAGSSTTAHSVYESNLKDGGNRNFINVQLPEPIPNNSEARKYGFRTICDVGKERIRRAGSMTKALYSNKDQAEKADLGYKVFKLDSSNIKKWNPGIDLRNSLLSFEDNLTSDSSRNDKDIVFEILLKLGLDLNSNVEEKQNYYSVENGTLMICLKDVESLDVAQTMIDEYKEKEPLVWKVVFKDNGFASDDVKANTRETLKMAGLQDGSFITL